ncbi:MAG: methyl-accepting chemotaxis protein [Alphaproteobacteria bacterium]
MKAFENLTIITKTFSGFGIVLALLLIIASVAYFSLNKSGNYFTDYRQLALQTTQAGRVQANLLETRMQVKNFVISANDDTISAVHERAKATQEHIYKMHDYVPDEQQIAAIDSIGEEMKSYVSHFEAAVLKQHKRNELVLEHLDVIGPRMERNLTSIMRSAYEDDDARAAYVAGQNLRELLLARLYVTKFLISNDQASYERSMQELASSEKGFQSLMAELQNPQRRQLAQKVVADIKDYRETFENVYKTIQERNNIITSRLDTIGPRIADKIEDMKLAIKERQDTLGPAAAAGIKNATMTMIVASVISIIFGMAAACYIACGIATPIKSMTNAMTELAGGNKSVDIPAQDLTNEIGEMAKAVFVFKDNMIKAEELAAQQAEEDQKKLKRAETINALIDSFELMIGDVTDILDQSANELLSMSAQLSSAMEETTAQSTSVASAAEEASANVQMVASAAEEMAASIREISQNVSDTANSAKACAEAANDSQKHLDELQQAVGEIDSVIQAINDVAEQTNLLALNATIEAARAGDAGKGFAVVASEVKTLAGQTHQMTDEIAQKIGHIKESAAGTIKTVNRILEQITDVDSKTTSVAGAVEEQNASSTEISRNVQEAAQGTEDVTRNVVGIQQAANESSASTAQLRSSAETLTEKAQNLKVEVRKFLDSVKAA